MVLSWRHFAHTYPGDIWQCLENILVVVSEREDVLAADIQWVEARGAANHPTPCRRGSAIKHSPAPNVNSAQVEKLL